jgi:hypothetical protein
MGASQSQETGLITVSKGGPAAATPAGDEALLAHLSALKERSKAIGTPAKGVGDPFRDLELTKTIADDTQQLSGGIAALLHSYQQFHDDHASAIVQNQTVVVNRLIDQARVHAPRCVTPTLRCAQPLLAPP